MYKGMIAAARVVLLLVLVNPLASTAGDAPLGGAPSIAWPLRPSRNGRYVTDSNGAPLLLIGDSTQSLLGSVSEADAETFFANRQSKGINANWFNPTTGAYTTIAGSPLANTGSHVFTPPGSGDWVLLLEAPK